MEDVNKDVAEEGADTKDESSESESDKVIPYSRFKEVVDKKNELEAELAKNKPKEEASPEKAKEAEAKNYLKNLLKETLEETKSETAKKEAEELSKLQSDVDDVVTKNPGVKKDDFLKFVEENGDDFASVASAMKHYRTINGITKEEADKVNKDKKPALPNSEAGPSNKSDYDDKGKSLSQIAEEANRGRG